MSAGNTFENDLAKLIFNAVAVANLADNAASSPLTNLQVSLHTADPGEAGDQSTNEVSYTGYGRVAVARTTSGWAVTNNAAAPVSAVTFGQQTNTATTNTITHFAVGTATSGAGKLFVSGTVSPNISMAQNVTPSLGTASTVTVE